MLIFGHKYLTGDSFYSISSINEIENTPSNSTVFFQFSEDKLPILHYAINNSIDVAIEIDSIKNAIFSEIFRVKYIIAKDLELAQEIQKIAEHYMFDSKTLTWIKADDELEKVAKIGLDGVIFRSHIHIPIKSKT